MKVWKSGELVGPTYYEKENIKTAQNATVNPVNPITLTPTPTLPIENLYEKNPTFSFRWKFAGLFTGLIQYNNEL